MWDFIQDWRGQSGRSLAPQVLPPSGERASAFEVEVEVEVEGEVEVEVEGEVEGEGEGEGEGEVEDEGEGGSEDARGAKSKSDASGAASVLVHPGVPDRTTSSQGQSRRRLIPREHTRKTRVEPVARPSGSFRLSHARDPRRALDPEARRARPPPF
jgi:hypothetical protein